jgi:hypothetical protein
MDHNTRFAKSLGFFEDAPWSLSVPEKGSGDQELEEQINRRLSYLAFEDEEINSMKPPNPPVDN